jgi:hypothetical protein
LSKALRMQQDLEDKKHEVIICNTSKSHFENYVQIFQRS